MFGRRRLVGSIVAVAAGGLTRHVWIRAARAADAERAISLQAGGHWGHLTITNNSPMSVSLKSVVLVEALSAGRWHPVVTEMNLVSACDPDGVVRPLKNDVELKARASLTPPPWRGWSCNGQCERHCRTNTYWGPGPFRFSVVTSDGRSFSSDPFKMPETPTQPDDVL